MSSGGNDQAKNNNKVPQKLYDRICKGGAKTKSLFSSARIHRVPEDLRKQNESAYTPRLIAIGPLHRDIEQRQKPMRDVKKFYTYYLLHRVAKGIQEEGKEKLEDNTKKMKGKESGESEDNAKKLLDDKRRELLEECEKQIKECLDEVAVKDKMEECLDHQLDPVAEVAVKDKMKECLHKVNKVNKASKYYAEEVEVGDDEIAEMMLVDGCFILELLCCDHDIKTKDAGKSTTNGGDSGNSKPTIGEEDGIRNPILDNILISNIVKHDLLLFENQIPFFVLEELFKLTVDKIPDKKIPGGKKLSLTEYVVSYFGDIMSPEGENSVSEKKTGCCSPSDCVLWVCGGSTKEIEQKKQGPWRANQEYDHILHLLHDYYGPGDQGENRQNSGKVPCAWPLTTARPRSTPPKKFSALEVRASELDHGGVKFVPAQGNSLFDVKFKEPKGICRLFHRATFEIPTVVINDSMETFLRNLIAYEQFRGISPELRYITSYAKLMDVLINSEKDVEVLSKANVIRNFSGTDEDVSKLLNKLCKEVVAGFFFEEACQQAFEYSKCCWPRYMAYWRRTYFAAPWAFKGVCLALILFFIQVANFVRLSLHKGF